MEYKSKADEFKKLIDEFKSVTILSHIRPDGDTIGSALAIYNLLKKLKKPVEVVCADSDLPIKYDFLKGFKNYKNKIDFKDSLIVCVDASEPKRVEFDLSQRVVVNIDHHISNSYFGKLNIVEVEVSTTVVVFKLLKELFKLNKDIVEPLYAGLVSDSVNFTTSLTTKDTFLIASKMLEYSIDPYFVATMINRRNSLAHLRAKGVVLNNLELFLDAKVAFSYMDDSDKLATGARNSDLDGIVDELISLATVEVAVFVTNFDGVIKASFRSKSIDVSKVALSFGGGGHKNAAGFEVKDGKIEEIKSKILEKLEDIL